MASFSRALLLCAFVAAIHGSAFASLQEVTEAQAHLVPDGQAPVDKTVSLPHRWDKEFPGRSGRAIYRLVIPPAASPGARALFIRRAANQVRVSSGGELLAQEGRLGDDGFDAARTPLLIRLPGDRPSADPQVVEIEATIQADRWGGLGRVQVGPQQEAEKEWRLHFIWRAQLAVALALTMATLALVMLGIWWVAREPALGILGLSSALGCIVYVSYAAAEPPLPWLLWGVLTKAAVIPHWMLLQWALLILAGASDRWLGGLSKWLAVVGAVAAAVSFGFGLPAAWTATLVAILPASALACWFAVRAAYGSQLTSNRLAAGMMVLELGAAGFDVFSVRVFGDGPGTLSVAPLGTAVMMMVMCWLLIDRHAQQTREYKTLLQSLDRKVAEREGALQQQMQRVREEHERNAALTERQRLVRDIHDGVGAHLVGLVGLLNAGANLDIVRDHARSALDELRMAVDAIQPVDGDLATVLASFRYRLQPRLDAAGIELVWRVGVVPELKSLDTQGVLQFQRILLEAFTNVLRHSKADRVTVTLEFLSGSSPALLLRIDDNGVGIAHADALGHGLGNMAARAKTIGASLAITRAPEGGTRVELTLEPAKAS